MSKGPKPGVKVGERFLNSLGDEYEVVAYRQAHKGIDIKFLSTGNIIRDVSAKEVKSGFIKNPLAKSVYGTGCFGEGPFKAKIAGRFTPEYQIWIGMMTRVYSEVERIKHPTYEEVTVCNEWLNFQNFANWCQTQVGFKMADPSVAAKRLALDKDLLIPNNYIYRPEACCFIPNDINVALKGRQRDKTAALPSGVYWHEASQSYTAAFGSKGKQEHLGCFANPEDAKRAFRKRKTEYLQQLAESYKDIISEQAYNALLNFNMDAREEYNTPYIN